MRFARTFPVIAGLVIAGGGVTSPLSAQQSNFSYTTMTATSDGSIDYKLVSKVPTWVWRPRWDPYTWEESGIWVLVHRAVVLRQDTRHWYSDRGLFAARPLTREEVLARGVSLAELNTFDENVERPVDRSLHPITFEEMSVMSNPGNPNLYTAVVDEADRRRGTIVLDVTFPEHPGGKWALQVTSAMGEDRFTILDAVPGPATLQVTDVEAGNCFATLIAVTPNGEATTYHREVPVLVRKNEPGAVAIQFSSENDPRRFRLHSLALGQTSQTPAADLPLQQGKMAMARVLAYDAFGSGGNSRPQVFPVEIRVLDRNGIQVAIQTFGSLMSSKLVKTGRVGSDQVGRPGPAIADHLIQPGISVEARLLDPATNQELDRITIRPEVIRPRHIVVHGYDVRPPGGSGVPVARDEAQMRAWILPYVQEAFPYSTVEYKWEKKIWIPQIAWGFWYLGQAMVHMNALQGMHQTDKNAGTEHLYLAMVNERYAGISTTGMAWYGYRGLALSRILDNQALAYNMVHEMGHCFQLEHAPSRGADARFGIHYNRVDANYPYGGGGMAGGWGYSPLGNYFLAEDNHRFEYSGKAHWDPMSYTYGSRNYSMTRFSDFYARNLKADFPGSHEAPKGASEADLGLAYHPSGIPVFGPEAAFQVEAQWAGMLGFSAPLRPLVPIMGWSWQGEFELDRDPMLGDPDDPTPPGMIVTQVPRIPGITVPQ